MELTNKFGVVAEGFSAGLKNRIRRIDSDRYHTFRYGVTVAQQILILFVQVQILVSNLYGPYDVMVA